MSFICYNGSFQPETQPGIFANNRGYKWGDSLFETIKVFNGKMLLQQFHFERLSISLKLLKINCLFIEKELADNILTLCQMNNCLELGRVRLVVYRNDDNTAGYTIEALPLEYKTMQWNEQGYVIDSYPFARKACDVFANVKTSNYLPYVMADLYAKEKELDEALVLNSFNKICDASKANIFCVKDHKLFTPAMDQGCINGVMRRFLIEEVKKEGWVVKQVELSEAFLMEADECFVTSAIKGIRWVRQYRTKNFESKAARKIFDLLSNQLGTTLL